jgi:uncharacterized protein (TIGR03437 family)
MRILILILCLGAPAAIAQPVVLDAVVNSASYALPGSANEGIALGSIFAAFGSNLADAGLWQVSEFPIRSTTPGGTSIAVTVHGTTVSALPLYTTPSQLAAILPSDCPVGDGTVTVTYKGQTSAAVPIHVVRNTFAIFTQNQQGSGPAACQNVHSATDWALNSFRTPARPGQVLVLWGTGLGPIAAPDGGLPPVGDLPVDVEVWVGGKQATVLYRGRSGCCAGLDQVNIYLPDGVEGCHVPVMVKAGGTISNFASLAIAAPGIHCSVPAWSDDDSANLPSDAPLRLGAVFLTELVSQKGRYVAVEGIFARMAPARLPDFGLPPPGSCTVLSTRGGKLGNDESTKALYETVTDGLDAGPSLTLSSPMYSEDEIVLQNPIGHYYDARELVDSLGFRRGGSYTIGNGTGGTDVKSFRSSMKLSRATKFSAIGGTVPRSEPLKVTWTAEDQAGIAIISGGAATEAEREDDRVSTSFTCTERASAGEFTIPATILQMLPKTATRGYLTVMHRRTAIKFEAEGLDSAFFIFREGFRAGTVIWQ